MFSHLVNLGNNSKRELCQISNSKSYIARGLTAPHLNFPFLCSHPTILSASLLLIKRCLLLMTCSSQSDWCAQILERCTNEAQEIVPKVPRPYFPRVFRRGEENRSGDETNTHQAIPADVHLHIVCTLYLSGPSTCPRPPSWILDRGLEGTVHTSVYPNTGRVVLAGFSGWYSV